MFKRTKKRAPPKGNIGSSPGADLRDQIPETDGVLDEIDKALQGSNKLLKLTRIIEAPSVVYGCGC